MGVEERRVSHVLLGTRSATSFLFHNLTLLLPLQHFMQGHSPILKIELCLLNLVHSVIETRSL